MSQLYRYLINYKRAIAADVRAPARRFGASPPSPWLVPAPCHVNYNSAPRFLNCRYRYHCVFPPPAACVTRQRCS